MTARTLSLREKRLIQGAVLLAIVVLVSLVLRGGSGGGGRDALPPGPAATAAPVAPAPAPMPAPVPAAAPVPSADLSQLRLHGLLATGAVIGFANGGQRLVPVGREALPGLALVRIEQNHAVFRGAGGEVRLGFDGVAAAQPGAGPAAPAPANAGEAAQREETVRYRLGLAPRMASGRVSGYTVRPNVEMPALARAGIRPGDVIVSVNGSSLDEERLQELAWTIANSGQTRFEVERGGRRLQLGLQPN